MKNIYNDVMEMLKEEKSKISKKLLVYQTKKELPELSKMMEYSGLKGINTEMIVLNTYTNI